MLINKQRPLKNFYGLLVENIKDNTKEYIKTDSSVELRNATRFPSTNCLREKASTVDNSTTHISKSFHDTDANPFEYCGNGDSDVGERIPIKHLTPKTPNDYQLGYNKVTDAPLAIGNFQKEIGRQLSQLNLGSLDDAQFSEKRRNLQISAQNVLLIKNHYKKSRISMEALLPEDYYVVRSNQNHYIKSLRNRNHHRKY